VSGKKGFTLIELLIVVAIIAILAAIAVPNFLEAQVRAKVSRCKTDMRSLAVALEAYYVDWNSYTCRAGGATPTGPQGWRQLTTPVAYIATIPWDPFGEVRWAGGTAWPAGTLRGGGMAVLYELGTGAIGVGNAGTPENPGVGFPSNTWYVDGDGPDKIDDTVATSEDSRLQWTWNAASYPWGAGSPVNLARLNNPAAVAEALGLVYDPTNGTVSRGDILRFGGMKPPGRVFDLLYGLAGGK